MDDTDPTANRQAAEPASWQIAITVLQEVAPAFLPLSAHVTTVVVEYPPGDAGAPPHRHAGPAFGYLLAGEMRFELEGLPERVIRAGEAFWEPGGHVIHYRDANNRDDIPLRFILTMLSDPGAELFLPVPAGELAERKDRRVSGDG